MTKTLLQNAVIMTLNKERETLYGYDLLIENDIIKLVEKHDPIKISAESTRVIDCSGKLIMPGLIDVHAHGGISLLRNVVKDTSQWMSSLTHTLDHCVDDEFWYTEAKISALRRLNFGVTTGVTILGTNPRCDVFSFAKSQTDAYAEIGVRNFLSVGPNSEPWPAQYGKYENGKRIETTVSYEDAIKSLETIVEKLHNSNSGLTKILLTPRQVVTSILTGTEGDMLEGLTEHDLRNTKEIRRIAKKYDTRIHTDAFRGMIKLAEKDPNALLGPDVHIQHNFGLSLDEVDILAKTGTKTSFTPTFAQIRLNTPVMEMLNKGITVAITSDGESYHSNFNMFEKMLLTQQMIRAIYKDRNYLPNEKIIEMMTIDAAKCIGMEDQIGSIECGKKADFLVISIDGLNLAPAFDLPHLVVREVRNSDIDHIFINGKQLMGSKKIMNSDISTIINQAQKKAEEIVQRAGLERFAYPTKEFWGEEKAYYEEIRFKLEKR